MKTDSRASFPLSTRTQSHPQGALVFIGLLCESWWSTMQTLKRHVKPERRPWCGALTSSGSTMTSQGMAQLAQWHPWCFSTVCLRRYSRILSTHFVITRTQSTSGPYGQKTKCTQGQNQIKSRKRPTHICQNQRSKKSRIPWRSRLLTRRCRLGLVSLRRDLV